MGKVYTRFQTETAQKPYGTYLYDLFKRVSPPPPPRPDLLVKEVPLTFGTVEFLFILTQQTCEQQNSTICSANQMASMCNTECTTGNGTNNPMAMNPTPTMTMTTMMTASVTTTPATTTAKTPTDAAEKLCPTFLGVLFIILFTILRQ